MNKSDNQRLTELLGGCWHEAKLFQDGINYKCSCGCLFYQGKMFKHIKESNPTYTHADEVLKPMREKLGEEKFKDFIYKLVGEDGDCTYGGQGRVRTVSNFINTYILNVPALVIKAIEFLKQMKGE